MLLKLIFKATELGRRPKFYTFQNSLFFTLSSIDHEIKQIWFSTG